MRRSLLVAIGKRHQVDFRNDSRHEEVSFWVRPVDRPVAESVLFSILRRFDPLKFV